MAAGDRNKNGKAIDIVCHFVPPSIFPAVHPICGRKVFWHSTTVKKEVTCKNCIKMLKKLNNESIQPS